MLFNVNYCCQKELVFVPCSLLTTLSKHESKQIASRADINASASNSQADRRITSNKTQSQESHSLTYKTRFVMSSYNLPVRTRNMDGTRDPFEDLETDIFMDNLPVPEVVYGERWFTCPLCTTRMIRYNSVWLCRLCLETSGHLVYADCYELERYHSSRC